MFLKFIIRPYIRLLPAYYYLFDTTLRIVYNSYSIDSFRQTADIYILNITARYATEVNTPHLSTVYIAYNDRYLPLSLCKLDI